MADFSDLMGKVLTNIDGTAGDDTMTFTCADGARYRMEHWQDCCESVLVEDIVGELADLLNMPILLAEEVSNQGDVPHAGDDSWTWTFYKLATNRGAVTIRWFGESNGYYSEEVEFVLLEDDDA